MVMKKIKFNIDVISSKPFYLVKKTHLCNRSNEAKSDKKSKFCFWVLLRHILAHGFYKLIDLAHSY